ncbi:MAG: hypothetical protein HPY52_11100 [Firmicutes bacterium]|nr:hypothetical protein [Bacillota bacterium]
MSSDKDKDDAQKVANIAQTEGWGVIKAWIESYCNVIAYSLIRGDHDRVEFARGQFHALQTLLGKVEEWKRKAKTEQIEQVGI